MRSLVRRQHQTHFTSPSPDTNLVTACVGASNEIYAIAQSSPVSFQIFKQPAADASLTAAAAATSQTEAERLASFSTSHPSHLVSAQYLAETDSLVLCFDAGEIVSVALEPDAPNAGQAEVVGEIEERICAATWSPDEELLVLITGQLKLLLFTKDFDVLSEGPIQTQDFGEAKPVNVGWGSTDTQFRGSIGKAAARPTAETTEQDFLNPEKDDLTPRISWRGDSAHFAVSTAEAAAAASQPSSDPQPQQNLRRVLRFFSRTAILQSTAEPTPGLEHALAWQPSGSIIASTSRSADHIQRDVIFYERNGLRRYEFPVVRPQATVKQLKWSPDSALLALWVGSDATHQQKQDGESDSVQLAFRNNYHWYTKQDLTVPQGSGPLVDIFFHPDNALQVFLLTTQFITSYTLQWDVLASSRAPPHDAGLVNVVDGRDLLVTPLRYENVPPPMSSYRLRNPDRSAQVPVHTTFSLDDDLLVALYPDFSFDLWQCFPAPAGQSQPPSLLLSQCAISVSSKQLQPLQIAAKGSLQQGVLRLALLCSAEEVSSLWIATVDLKSQTCDVAEPLLGEAFEQLAAFSRGFITQVRGGGLQAMSTEAEETTDILEDACLPEMCTKIAPVELPDRPVRVLGLTSSGRLYAGTQLLSPEATSFVVCGNFLIFTTTSHTARFIALSDLSQPEGRITDFDPTKAQARRLERGSRIVAGIASSMTLILQMPRGNLETICPRPLVLEVVMDELDQLRFREAFVNCRKHRIDLNLLADHDPATFMDNLPLFLEQIPEVDHLNLFVSALADTDVALSSYPSNRHAARDPEWAGSKTNTICRSIREHLSEKDLRGYINTVLTTHLCESPPDHEAALRTLASFRRSHPEEADDAVQYIVFLADVNQLFDVALGLYDFSLTLLIAQNSQKDPKEYLPFLKNLKQLDTCIQRHQIDDHLRRYAKALANLVAAGPAHFEEVKSYVQIHGLYSEALALYTEDLPKLRSIHQIHGDYLYSRNKYDQAALSFSLSLDRDRAIDAYMLANNWQQCFALALAGTHPGQGPVAVGKIGTLALEISQRLKGISRHREAARVLLDYGRDIEASISASCEGSDFEEAIRNATLYSRTDLISSTVGPAVLEHADNLLETVTDVRSQIEKQRSRIAELDVLRAEDQDAYFGEMDITAIDGVEVDDSASTAAGTGFTRYTKATGTTGVTRSSRASMGSTAKARRKEERKKAAGGKKGTVWEEEYLLGSLSRMVETRLSSLQNDVAAALPLLLTLGGAGNKSGTSRARALQDALKDLEIYLKESVDAVWASESPRAPEILASKDLVGLVKKPTPSSTRWTIDLL